MKCPKCSAQVFEEDKFCGECGQDLTKMKPLEGDPDSVLNDANQDSDLKESEKINNYNSPAGQGNEKAKTYFSEVLSFFKDAVLSPGRSIGRRYDISIVAGTVGLLLLIGSLITFIQMRSALGDVVVPFSTLFEYLIAMVILFGVFFGITYLLILIVIRESKHWKDVFNDFSIPAIIVFTLFILASLLNLITLYEIGFLVSLIGFLLFITEPVYILLRYAENNNVKFDSFYALIIYYVLAAIVFYIMGRLVIGMFMENFIYELNNMMF